ncbi:hypothetical protein [Mycobacterium sp. 94-17]|uniref:hypothetical protein n=1 Tax=Mycobacterium sp. 94-17 TaxID=2986147 RepID=UPI002D1E4EBD|nr:hypothetical protein [Mycobacterium sp. 94-17]MEB4208751.1 hypothetical protein [Mycobacterium sp. 94-17]
MNGPELAALMGAWVAVPRMPDAACRAETWMADLDVSSSAGEQIDAGIETCLGCRELQRCSDWLDSLPADHYPRGVVAARLVDPAAYQTARAAMVAVLKPHPPKVAPRPRGPRRPARRLLAAVEAASDGLTPREAAVALHSPDVTTTQIELARQGLQRLVLRGCAGRVDSQRIHCSESMVAGELFDDNALTPARPAGAAGRAAEAWPRHRAKNRQRRRRNARKARKGNNTRGTKQ